MLDACDGPSFNDALQDPTACIEALIKEAQRSPLDKLYDEHIAAKRQRA